MHRVLIAVGAAVIVAAALIGYYLIGGDGQEASTVAETPGTAAESQAVAADTPPPAPAPAQTGGQAADAGAAAKPDEPAAVSDTPVVQVKPRTPAAPAATQSAAAPTTPEQTSPTQPSATKQNMEPAAASAQTSAAAAPPPVLEPPSFDVVRVEKTGETVIAGRAAPDSEVNVTTQDGTSLGRAKADASGAWAIVPDQPLQPGSHEIGIESQTAEGSTALSEEVVVVMVPEPKAAASAAAAKPKETESPAAAPAAGEQVLAVLTPRQGGASKVLPQDPEDGIVHGDLVLDSVDYNEAGEAVIGGRAAPGSRVVVYLDNRLQGDSVAGIDGRWSFMPANPVAEGLHQLRVDQVDGSGKVIARVETPFSREPVRVAQAGEEFVIVQPGNSLWRIARRTYGHGLQYSVIYKANQEQIRDPDLIYPGQVFELPSIN